MKENKGNKESFYLNNKPKTVVFIGEEKNQRKITMAGVWTPPDRSEKRNEVKEVSGAGEGVRGGRRLVVWVSFLPGLVMSNRNGARWFIDFS